MVLPAPPAHASPAEPRWLDRLVVAIELSAHGVLALVDDAVPARLREAYLRLRARDPATEVIVDVRKLAELPLGATAILALSPTSGGEDLDWLNLNRPVVSDRRLSVVLWCEDGAAAVLAQRAPDFFDWISARVDCPPAPAAHAVADVKRAICARASGIAWDGPGLEETLAAVRPGRPIRRVAVASYQSMIDALTSRERGWLFLEGIDTAFHLRRLRWAMAETGRRVIVFRRAFEQPAPGWWTVHVRQYPIVQAVYSFTRVGFTGRLAALTGLDVDMVDYARLALLHGQIGAAHLEDLLAAASDPHAVLQRFALWEASKRDAARYERDNDPVVLALRGQPLDSDQWLKLSIEAQIAGDFEIEVRWMTAAWRLLPSDTRPLYVANLLTNRGQAHRRAGHIASARADLERSYSIAQDAKNAPLISWSAALLGPVLLEQGEPLRARECLESALSASAELGDQDVAALLNVLATVLRAQGNLVGARQHLERSLEIMQRALGTEDHPSMVDTLRELGAVLVAQGDVDRARPYLQRSFEIVERSWHFHPKFEATLHSLAEVYRTIGDIRRARSYLVRALELQRATLSSDQHPNIAATFVTLARVIAAGGDLYTAKAMLERALATQQTVFGDDGQIAGAETRRALADVLVSTGDLIGAIGHLQQALATLRKIFQRDDHPDIVATLRELERLQKLQGELERAD